MKNFIISLVAHCERVWWDSSYDGLRRAVEAIVNLQSELSASLQKPVTSTFCTHIDHDSTTSYVVDAKEAPDVVQLIVSKHNELGLHIHGPTKQHINGYQDQCIVPDANILEKLGLPRPQTYTAGDWVTGDTIVKQLELAHFKVDCSSYSLEGPLNRFSVELDYSLPTLLPYRPSRTNIHTDGDSSIVEIPVSGNLTEFGHSVYSGFLPIQERVRQRYLNLTEGIDVFQVFWHPFEIVTLDGKGCDILRESRMRQREGKGTVGIDHTIVASLKQFLLDFGALPDVEIASAAMAATQWEHHQTCQ